MLVVFPILLYIKQGWRLELCRLWEWNKLFFQYQQNKGAGSFSIRRMIPNWYSKGTVIKYNIFRIFSKSELRRSYLLTSQIYCKILLIFLSFFLTMLLHCSAQYPKFVTCSIIVIKKACNRKKKAWFMFKYILWWT